MDLDLYLTVNEFDLAINMYKKREEYEQMLRLVSKFRKELLNDTYKHIAEQYEMKGNLKKAEHYYVEAKMWTSAMSMYNTICRVGRLRSEGTLSTSDLGSSASRNALSRPSNPDLELSGTLAASKLDL